MRELQIKIQSLKKDCLLATQVEYRIDKPILTTMTGGHFWGQKDEMWSIFDAKPMIPILSILPSELPFNIRHFKDIELINIFAYEEGAPIDEQEGSVVIRTYKDISALLPLEKPNELKKPCCLINWKEVTDYPNGYQLEQSLTENVFHENSS